jgi:hypothetical protein
LDVQESPRLLRDGETASVIHGWVEEANHGDHSEPLTALVVEARTMLEHATTMQAQRVRAAAEEAAAAAAVKAYVLCGRATVEAEPAR